MYKTRQRLDYGNGLAYWQAGQHCPVAAPHVENLRYFDHGMLPPYVDAPEKARTVDEKIFV